MHCTAPQPFAPIRQSASLLIRTRVTYIAVATQRSVEYDGTPSGPRMPSASSVLQQPPSSDLPAYVEAADTPATHEAEKFAMED